MQNNYRSKARFLKAKGMRRPFLKSYYISKLPAAFLIIGILVGSVIMQLSLNSNNDFAIYFANEIINAYSLPFAQIMSYVYLTLLFTHLFVFLNAFSCLGAPFILVAVFSNGFVYGLISSFLYSKMGAYGLVANLFVFLLPQIINSILLLLFSTKSIKLSINMLKLIVFNKNDVPLKLKLFLRTFLYFCIAILIASLFSAALSIIFVPVLF